MTNEKSQNGHNFAFKKIKKKTKHVRRGKPVTTKQNQTTIVLFFEYIHTKYNTTISTIITKTIYA